MNERREWRVVNDFYVWATLTTEAAARACLERAGRTFLPGPWRIESRVVGEWERVPEAGGEGVSVYGVRIEDDSPLFARVEVDDDV